MKNRLDTNNIDVIYCLIGEMLVDFYTKLLQGKFSVLMNVIMVLQHIRTLKRDTTSADQERDGSTVVMVVSKTGTTEICEPTNITSNINDVDKTT